MPAADILPRVTPQRLALGNAYLVEGPSGLVLVDAGGTGSAKALLAALQGRKLRLILITHAHLDHCGAAAAIRRATGAPIAIHAADADAMAHGDTAISSAHSYGRVVKAFLPLAELFLRPEPAAADILLDDGADLSSYLGLSARVLHTPGHTPGSISLLTAGGHAFVGDLLTSSGGAHVQRLFADDWTQIGPSVARLAREPLTTIWPGHGAHPLTAAELRILNHG